MKKNNTILLAIRTLSYQGGKILGNRWLPLVDSIRQAVAKSGFEQPESNDDLLLFTFPNLFLALISLLESLDKCKEEHGWQESHGAVPVQLVIHLVEEDDSMPQIQQPSAADWDLLQLETVYITRPLMKKWQELLNGRELPEHTFADDGGGFFQMIFQGKANVRQVELFAYRNLPLHGKMNECFYCGMTSHAPANCPSKLITMKMSGLDLVGYLPFEELNTLYKKIFPDYSGCSKKCASVIKPAQLRKDKELLVFVSYLDINRLYQLRFLANIAFCLYSKWDGQDKTDKIKIDLPNLHLGFDCLRVGQYDQAEELLSRENKRREGKPFYASVGLAFWALEKGRSKDMGHYLERARNIASQEKELLYSHLLLSRYYELQNDSWTAKESINQAIKVNSEALECQYRKMQYNVRYGFDEGDLRRLRSLMVGQKEVFMTALLDPLLLPVQGLVNDLALGHLQQVRQDAMKNLALAEVELADLKYWLGEEDPIVEENKQALQEQQKQYSRGTYYDLLEVLERAKGIAYACQRIRKAKIEEIELRKKELDNRLGLHHDFWNSYEYKSYFTTYQELIAKTGNSLKQAQALIAKQQGHEFRAAVNLLDLADISFSALQEKQEKMMWIRVLLTGVKLFVKKAIISELALFFAGFIIFMVLPMGLKESSYSGLYSVISDPLVQKKSMLISAFFLAPLIALIWTLWQLRDEQ